MTTETDPFVDWDGAYVLGALGADDRREYEQHLAWCGRCARAVGELAGIPGLLALVPAADVGDESAAGERSAAGASDEQVAPPVSLLARRARASRTRRRLVTVAAAVALVVVGGCVGGLVVSSLDDETPAVVAADAREVRLDPVDDSGVAADLTLEPAVWGTRLTWSCTYPSGAYVDGVEYELTLVDRAGQRSTVATWSGGTSRAATGLSAATALTPGDIASIEMSVAATTTPLATVTLDAG